MAVTIPKITFEDKIDKNISSADSRNLIRAQDINEIKNTFNKTASVIEESANNLESAVSTAKTSAESAKTSADSVLNGLGLLVVDGCICMEGSDS